MGIYKRILHNLQYHDGCNVDQGSFIPATSHTHKQKTGLQTWPVTTHYSYQTLIFHSIVEVETHIA